MCPKKKKKPPAYDYITDNHGISKTPIPFQIQRLLKRIEEK